MQFVINKKNEITSYVISGDLENGVIYTGDVPDDFFQEFKPKFYIFKNNNILKNGNFVDEVVERPAGNLTPQDKINANFYKVQLDMQKQIMEMKQNG